MKRGSDKEALAGEQEDASEGGRSLAVEELRLPLGRDNPAVIVRWRNPVEDIRPGAR